MSFFTRNLGKYLSSAANILGKEFGKRSMYVKSTGSTVVNQRVVNNRSHYQKNVTSNNSDRNDKNGSYSESVYIFVSAGILNFFGLRKEDPDEEPELIKTIKRGVLLIQKGEFKKAEQMLHIALKLAQEQQNYDGVTYIYDLLANLAYEQGELEKSEKLFVSVMQRLLSIGVPKTDNKIIHISLKLADIYKIQKDTRKAEEGYKFCATSLQNNIEEGKNDEDTLLLWAMTLDWYAKFLIDMNRLPEAFEYFKKAYNLCVQINGMNHEETVVLLNDLGTICFVQDDFDKAISYLTQAVTIGNNLPDMQDFGSVLVNLGTVYMKKGMFKEAKQLYQEAWQNAKRHKNDEVLREASSCLDELKVLETA